MFKYTISISNSIFHLSLTLLSFDSKYLKNLQAPPLNDKFKIKCFSEVEIYFYKSRQLFPAIFTR